MSDKPKTFEEWLRTSEQVKCTDQSLLTGEVIRQMKLIWSAGDEAARQEMQAEIDKRNFLIKDSVDLLSAIKNDQNRSWSYLISKYLENIKELNQGSKDGIHS